MDKLYTLIEAGVRLKLSPSRLRHLIRDKRLTATKMGRDLFVNNAEIERFKALERKPGRPRRPAAPPHHHERFPTGTVMLKRRTVFPTL